MVPLLIRDPFSPMVSEELSGMSSDESLGTSKGNSRVEFPSVSYTHLDVYKRQPYHITFFGSDISVAVIVALRKELK